jgi:hypothetical protein
MTQFKIFAITSSCLLTIKTKPKVQFANELFFLSVADEQKPISWEDPLPRSSNNLNTLNNNQETSFYHHPQILHLNSIVNNNHLNNSSSSNTSPTIINHHHQHKAHKKLEHTSSVRSTISSEDSWCPSEDHDNDDISSTYNDEDDALSDRSNSLISSARNSQLRLTFNKAKQHLSFDKWRRDSTSTMPTSNVQNQESPGEPLSRLSRWFSIRRGSHQYDLNSNSATNSPNRSGSIEKENDEKLANGKKMPQLQEVRELLMN